MKRCLSSLFFGLLVACGMPMPTADAGSSDGGAACTITLTGAYPDSTFATAAAQEAALLGRLNALNAPMRAAELDAGVTTDRATLEGLFDAGTPSLASLTTPAFSPVLDAALTAFLAAQGRVWTPANPATGTGGILGTGANQWIFSERGVDLRQLVDKGFYGALFYAEAVKRMPTATSPESIDKLVALFGATPAFPQNDTTAMGRDELMAKYAKRRTPQGMTGSYTVLKEAFVKARLASTSTACSAERVAALEVIKTEWERVIASTVIFYVSSAATKLQDPAADTAKKASAMHDLGEGASFFLGLKAVPAANRKITDAQLDSVLAALKAASLSQATLYRLLTDVPPDVDGVLSASTQLQQIYGFTADEMTRFKTNY